MSDLSVIAEDKSSLLDKIENFESFLSSLGLPSSNIIASEKERQVIGKNLVEFLNNLDSEVKRDARYLSKFTAGAAIGLFDASLNYLWNEVVINLRKKVIAYGLDLFFDAAVGGSRRSFYNDENDLPGIKDEVLVNTCKKIEIISDIVSIKLHYIQAMRNEIGASHPTTYSINAFDLLSWLATCVQEVLNEKPSESAIKIKAFFDNLKKSTSIIDMPTIQSMEKPISELSQHNADNLLNSIFNIFVSDKTDNIVRKNIALIIKNIWNVCSENIKFNIGVMLDGFRNNLHQDKYKLGCELLDVCDGNKYKTLSARIIELSSLTNLLLDARYRWDNFYNEPAYIQRINTFFKTEADIPVEIQDKIIQAVLICRIGKGTYYCNGVSPIGLISYNYFLELLGDDKIVHAICQMHSIEVRFNINNDISQKQALDILNIFIKNVRSDRIKDILKYMVNNIKNFQSLLHDKNFRSLTNGVINWND